MSANRLIESSLRAFTKAMSRALVSEQLAAQKGLLQALDPRVRLIGILMLILAVVLSRRLWVIVVLLLLAVLVAVMSRVPIATLAKRVWLVVLLFTGLIAAPALFITPGDPAFRIANLTMSAQGLRTAAFLVLRAETAVTLTTVLVLCTEWNNLLKALRSLRIPAEVITMLAMTHRYVFLLLETTSQMFESRQSRAVGHLSGTEQRRGIASTGGVLLSKSMELSHEVYLAMLSRGFQGDVRSLTNFRLRPLDYLAFCGFSAVSFTAVWLGRLS